MGSINAYHSNKQVELCNPGTPSLQPRSCSLIFSSLCITQGSFERPLDSPQTWTFGRHCESGFTTNLKPSTRKPYKSF
ncbi:hypothetical protein TNIN_364131 [Trichonephila inaurata madagascariensis]|uniref:Uncharacterized protein n=1 Tax=Trichonephila inaurata madagascariensis TaxID=2747483 RepID=A0A8X7CHY7_9ARAC|nr:hypothetical protein TNIN_364131 [Trichonephila inaurata madagascariensis]